MPEAYAGLTAPVQGHYAKDDQMYPEAAAHALEQQIRDESGSPLVEFFYYDAGHAFMNPEDKMGTYQEPLAEQAWSRTVGFLRTNLASA